MSVNIHSVFVYTGISLAILATTGCVHVTPPDHTAAVEVRKLAAPALTLAPTSAAPSPTLAERFEQIQKTRPDSHPLFPLPRSTDGFAGRIYLLRQATRSIDMQYYIWSDDTVGQLMFNEMLKAANRGVKIRLLLDDFGSRGMDSTILAMAQHPNIQIRLFNPTYHRKLWWLDFAGHFKALQHRMHNKNVIVDQTFLIAGGRNISNAYFQDTNQKTVFADLDILTAGQPAREATGYFERFWNSRYAYPVQQVAKFNRKQVEQALAKIAAAPDEPKSRAYIQEVDANDMFAGLLAGTEKFVWGKVKYISDRPEKIAGLEKPEDTIPGQTLALMTNPDKYVNIISAYFVPGHTLTNTLNGLQQRGIKVRVLTNSLASTDAFAVYSFYAPLRRPLLNSGVEIHEFRPDQFLPTAINGKWIMKRQDHGALHGKVYQWDDKNAFVGSFNLDPRSLKQNTEDGLLLESDVIAGAINTSLNEHLPSTAYRVLPRTGHPRKLQWIQTDKERQTIYTHSPKANVFYRLVTWVTGLIHPLKEYV